MSSTPKKDGDFGVFVAFPVRIFAGQPHGNLCHYPQQRSQQSEILEATLEDNQSLTGIKFDGWKR